MLWVPGQRAGTTTTTDTIAEDAADNSDAAAEATAEKSGDDEAPEPAEEEKGEKEEREEGDAPRPDSWLAESFTQLTEDARLGTVTCSANYEVTFDLKVLGTVDDFSSLLRFARGDPDDPDNDDRSPAFFFPKDSTSLRVYISTKRRPKHMLQLATELPVGKEMKVRLVVRGAVAELFVGDERWVHDPKMGERESGEEATCFAGDNHHIPANAQVRGVHYRALD